MTDSTSASSNTCYRHPDRQSFVLCQRCGRTICPECQTPAAVGVHCPECVREQRAKFTENRRASGPSSLTVARRRFAMLDQKGTVVLIAVSVAIWLLDRLSGGFLSQWLAYNSALLPTQPWRIVTVLFVHSGVFHILFNMWALFIFGRMLENMLGTWRFLALYFISGIAGSMLVTFLAPGTWVVGASGAIFGLFAAFFVLQRSLGNNAVQLLVIIGLNLVIGFLPGTNISWQAHVGGVLAGFVTGFVFSRTRNVRQRGLQMTLLALEAVVAIALCFVGYAVTTG
ncbi:MULTISPECIES: rhomboid family intramembrane serine protease [Curtobacterium]|uniref:rhomboid family intramembrane serine protease n=1 Tax=Curtobacterium TaxID=2034 RepID=UPI001C8E74E0|nr:MULTISPECIES: rhomboid family intramembrane serine protease [Curtobacterium]MBY0175528.1 rhomboid family intramembrane serine protease [Curtobacterium herbarum]MCP1503683.1 membrane associated rhomboid family serine protease [Curtobacterium herbarum]MDN3478707.1 rhomboid family intramembrane serine protease [Curtobacterium sp. APC 4022]MDY1003701.1 rhomboid family intramembrane serine protease [Curtobacterium sp. CFBP9011]